MELKEKILDLINTNCVSQLYLLKHKEIKDAIESMENLADEIIKVIPKQRSEIDLCNEIILALEEPEGKLGLGRTQRGAVAVWVAKALSQDKEKDMSIYCCCDSASKQNTLCPIHKPLPKKTCLNCGIIKTKGCNYFISREDIDACGVWKPKSPKIEPLNLSKVESSPYAIECKINEIINHLNR